MARKNISCLFVCFSLLVGMLSPGNLNANDFPWSLFLPAIQSNDCRGKNSQDFDWIRIFLSGAIGNSVTIRKQQIQFVAYGINSQGKIIDITGQVRWMSSNEQIVAIDENGLATIMMLNGQVGIMALSCPSFLLTASTILRITPGSNGTCASIGVPQTVSWSGREWQIYNDGKSYNWDEAEAYCRDLVLNCHSDWRLPTKSELLGSIRSAGLSRYNSGFGYWSSSKYGTYSAWMYLLHNGRLEVRTRNYPYSVRCVR